MTIDATRHLSVFSPHKFGNKRVDVIGCGATGSRIALSLAKLGVTNLHIWDFDKVEEHNIANQVYNMEDVGSLKVEALYNIIEKSLGIGLNDLSGPITVCPDKVDGSQPLGNIVFILTDTMSSRKEIWKGLKYKPNLELVVETRMGADSGRVYAFNPNNPIHTKEWEATLYSDEKAETSACGASVSVGPTAEIISGLAVWQMIRWFNEVEEGGDTLENEVIVSTRPMVILTRAF